MNRERFISLVKNPSLLKAEDTPLLEEVLKEFPYFQTAHLLTARCYKVSDSIYLQKQIKNAAAHIIDRRVLYHLIENFQIQNDKKPISSIVESEPAEVINAKLDPTAQSLEANLPIEAQLTEETFIADINELELSIEEPLLHVTEDFNENASTEHHVSENIEKSSASELIHKNKKDEGPEFEIPLQNEIKLVSAESQFFKEFEQKKDEITEINVETDIKHSHFEQFSPIHIKIEEITVEAGENNLENEAQTEFVKWLKNLKSYSAHNEILEENIPVKKENKIIEDFIEKPVQRVKPTKQDFYNPVNMAKQSVTDNDFFVTETLAKIYIKQGNLAKAIKVYQNLSLKNPEKNNIFAAQIKILKEQLHNKTGK